MEKGMDAMNLWRGLLSTARRRISSLAIIAIVFICITQLTSVHVQASLKRPAVPGFFGKTSQRNVEPHKTPTFPKKIWQTWKVDALNLEEREFERIGSWLAKNPTYQYELLTDTNAEEYVKFHFGPGGLDKPYILNTFLDMTDHILRADLLRYMVMYVEGGVYTDIDTVALRPVSQWIPRHYDQRDISMVIGVEVDEPDWAEYHKDFAQTTGFCQWTFMCKPGHPVMLRLLEHAISQVHRLSQLQKCRVSEIKPSFREVLNITGPAAFTNAILGYMNRDIGGTDERTGKKKGKITWDEFHAITESVVVEDILVLTVEAFAASSPHSDSGSINSNHALVQHLYGASNWPEGHPRADRELEDCNYDEKCIAEYKAKQVEKGLTDSSVVGGPIVELCNGDQTCIDNYIKSQNNDREEKPAVGPDSDSGVSDFMAEAMKDQSERQ
ncbi:hypothetical protein PYCC9005_001766 [Savitreella phatthalungensis]